SAAIRDTMTARAPRSYARIAVPYDTRREHRPAPRANNGRLDRMRRVTLHMARGFAFGSILDGGPLPFPFHCDGGGLIDAVRHGRQGSGPRQGRTGGDDGVSRSKRRHSSRITEDHRGHRAIGHGPAGNGVAPGRDTASPPPRRLRHGYHDTAAAREPTTPHD